MCGRNVGFGIVQGKRKIMKGSEACIDCVYLLCEMRMGMGMGEMGERWLLEMGERLRG